MITTKTYIVPTHYYTNDRGTVFSTNNLCFALLRAKYYNTEVFTYLNGKKISCI
jgi:hypothetical protein